MGNNFRTSLLKQSLVLCGIFSVAAVFAAKPPPNVLMIVADDLNDYEGAYGHLLAKTPNIDKLAEQSLRFERAYCQYPLCGPSRASFMTGLYPEQNGVTTLRAHFRKIVPNAVTFSQFFEKQGYRTARVGKIYHMDNPKGIGTNQHDDDASWQERFNPVGIEKSFKDIRRLANKGVKIRWVSGSDSKTGATLSWLAADGKTPSGEDRNDPTLHTDGRVATQAIELIDQYTDTERSPFFLAVGFFKPHTPYIAPKQFFDLYDLDTIKVPPVPNNYFKTLPAEHVRMLKKHAPDGEFPEGMARETIHAYLATISFLDSQVGRVLTALDDPNGDGDTSDSIRDNTIVLFFSDHGYHMGEHNHYQKGTLFEESARVPLLIRAPGMKTAGKSTGAPVELVDLYPTVAELAGFAPPKEISGVSLAELMKDVSARPRNTSLTMEQNGYSIRTEQYRYTRFGDGGPGDIELYDVIADFEELNNLAYSDPIRYASVITEMDRLLQERIEDAR